MAPRTRQAQGAIASKLSESSFIKSGYSYFSHVRLLATGTVDTGVTTYIVPAGTEVEAFSYQKGQDMGSRADNPPVPSTLPVRRACGRWSRSVIAGPSGVRASRYEHSERERNARLRGGRNPRRERANHWTQ